jgi:streptomycin 6-kinase
MRISSNLRTNCLDYQDRAAWLRRLPDTVQMLKRRWFLTLGPVFDSDCAWVSSVKLKDATPAVLKAGMPHMEGENELQGMLFWNGDPTALVLEADPESNAFLLERCVTGLKTVEWSVFSSS